MAKPTSTVPADKLAQYEAVLTLAKLERKGNTMPYTSLNGHMYSFLSASGVLALRLGETERLDFIKKFKTKLMEQHGTVLKEYVVVPAVLLQDAKTLRPYFDLSLQYIRTLKPKPTKKKK